MNYDVQFESHAEAILKHDFPEAAEHLDQILSEFRVNVRELVQGGGGESEPTQRLRRALASAGWRNHTYVIKKSVDGVDREATSHIVDHHGRYQNGAIALELEWNNKDTFFDRDLENFKRLHIDSAISVGVIVTRGESFQANLTKSISSYCRHHGINSINKLSEFNITRTPRQLKMIEAKMVNLSFEEAFAATFVSDKFGVATTHWQKLKERLNRGAGGSCPLVLLGWPLEILS